MPRLDNLPSLEIIRGLKGVLDFYYWKGIPCVRKWPHIPPSSRTPASMASAALFGAVVQGYALLGGALKTLFDQDAADQPRTARDLYVSAVLGHLHEVPMTDFLDLLTQATAYLQALTDLTHALHSNGTDPLVTLPAYDGTDWQALLVDAQRHLQADVLASALPAGAATAAHQVTQNTALALIEKLENALQSVHTDRLLVRGQDQLVSYLEPYAELDVEYNATLGLNALTGSNVPAGQVWVVTNLHAHNEDTINSTIRLLFSIAPHMPIAKLRVNPPLLEGVDWQGAQTMEPGDRAWARFYDCVAADNIYLSLLGYKFTKET